MTKGKYDFRVRLEFGKHKGLLIPEIARQDRQYLHWLIGPLGHSAIMKSQGNWEDLWEETNEAWYEFTMWC